MSESTKQLPAQELFDQFIEQHRLDLQPYVVTPKTRCLVHLLEFLPDGWFMIKYEASYRDDQPNR